MEKKIRLFKDGSNVSTPRGLMKVCSFDGTHYLCRLVKKDGTIDQRRNYRFWLESQISLHK